MRIGSRYDLQELALRAEEARNDDASFDAFSIEMVHCVPETCVDLKPAVPEVARQGLIWGAITGPQHSPVWYRF
jgi:hypothetical protein